MAVQLIPIDGIDVKTGHRKNTVHREARAVRQRVDDDVREASQGGRARQRRFDEQPGRRPRGDGVRQFPRVGRDLWYYSSETRLDISQLQVLPEAHEGFVHLRILIIPQKEL